MFTLSVLLKSRVRTRCKFLVNCHRLIVITLLFFPLICFADSFNRAESLFEEDLFSDALIQYENSLNSENAQEKKLFIQKRLAECHLELKDPTAALSSLNQMTEPDPYLMAVAYRLLQNYKKSIDLLHTIPFTQEIAFEMGCNYFYLGNFSEATTAFKYVKESFSTINFYPISQLFLAQIAINKDEINLAKEHLNNLNLSNNPSLSFEKHYWLGVCAFHEKDYAKAIDYFDQSLPKKSQQNQLSTFTPYHQSTLRFLAWSKIKLAESTSKEKQPQLLFQAEELFQRLLSISQEESLLADLGEYHLIKGALLTDRTSSEQAKDLSLQLGQSNQAESAYLKGLCALDQGAYLQTIGSIDLSQKSFREAAEAFQMAQIAFSQIDHPKTALSVKYKALAYYHEGTSESKIKAIEILDQLVHQQPNILELMKNPQEIYFILALMSTSDPQKLETIIQEGMDYAPQGTYADLLTKMKGLHYLQTDRKPDADAVFKLLIEKFPHSSYLAEAWFCRAQCVKNEEEKKEYLTHVYQYYPNSLFAPEAYFSLYSYREYVNGHRQSIKHLKAMPDRFPNSPLVMSAYYLIGLDHKKDRLSDEGRVIQRKNLIAAIDAFQQTELAFERLYTTKKMENDLSYYIQLRYKASLERALTNLAIANESQSAKKIIYLDYAKSVFTDIANELNDAKNNLVQLLGKEGIRDELLDETEFWLAKTFIHHQDKKKADEAFKRLIERHQNNHLATSYFFSRAFYERAMLAFNQQQYQKALDYLLLAEKNAQGLSIEQKLDLWIQQSFCYSSLNQLNDAMSLLSKVINEDAISGLRVKAMFLRSEVYEKQGRPELAMKQLKATSKKGGEWGQKAKEKLEQDYEH